MFNVDMAFKKIINDPYQVVDEMVEGIVLAHSAVSYTHLTLPTKA